MTSLPKYHYSWVGKARLRLCQHLLHVTFYINEGVIIICESKSLSVNFTLCHFSDNKISKFYVFRAKSRMRGLTSCGNAWRFINQLIYRLDSWFIIQIHESIFLIIMEVFLYFKYFYTEFNKIYQSDLIYIWFMILLLDRTRFI